ncbi:Transposase IS4 [Popillia japonica]|uniref:Transposase IS4 n=1 Tax=Popillia japonica TaxID=7064 RepID=A0AAW1KLH4_POPJA
MKIEHTLACRTIRSDRAGLPTNLIDRKALKRGQRYDCRFSSMDIAVWKWQDRKTVYVDSNFHASEETTGKRTEKGGTKKEIPAPMAVPDYNKNMGGMDHADRLRAV